MDSFVLLAYVSLKNPFEQLLAGLKFTLDSENSFSWYKWKKWFLWTMAAAQAAKKWGDEWGLIRYLWWEIYTSILT